MGSVIRPNWLLTANMKDMGKPLADIGTRTYVSPYGSRYAMKQFPSPSNLSIRPLLKITPRLLACAHELQRDYQW